MLLSDLIPLILFTVLFICIHHPLLLAGPIISRLCSLIYHAHETTHPALLYLDYLGICSMALSVPAACGMAEDGWRVATTVGNPQSSWCGPFNTGIAIAALLAAAALAAHASGRPAPRLPSSPEHAVVALGLMGNLPVAAIVACPRLPAAPRLLSALSLLALAVGYFGLKPRRHVLWHWAAAAAQAAGVAAVAVHSK